MTPAPAAWVGVDHVQVAAPPGSEDVARRFYVELLGLAELAKPASLAGRGGIWVRCGAHELHVGVDPDFRAARKAHPALRLVDPTALRELAARLETAGVPVAWDDALPSVTRLYAEDPFGNRLELLAEG